MPQHDELAKLWLAVARKFGSKLVVREEFTAAAPPTVPPVPAKAAPAPAKAEPAKPGPPKQPPPKQQEASKPAQPVSTEAAPKAAKPAQTSTTETAPTKAATNAAPATTAPAQSAAPTQSAPATPPKPAADPAGHFVLQLASLPSQAEAERASAALKSGHADLLGKLDFTIHRADLGAAKGVWYRLRRPARRP